MVRKACFGSIQELVYKDDMTMTQTMPDCIQCDDFRECMQYVKERDELRKQNMIAQMIDMSHVISNEMGGCLLKFLSRIYSSPLGLALLKNLFLFYEMPPNKVSMTVTIPISPSTVDLMKGGEVTMAHPEDPSITYKQDVLGDGFILRLVMIQKCFKGNQDANMGLIAHEVAHMFAADTLGNQQILSALSADGVKQYNKMGLEQKTSWLIERWGFKEEFKAFQKEMGLPDKVKPVALVPSRK
jgi:hypothetical protein